SRWRCCRDWEVVVGRPASVFVRDLAPEEAQRLRRVSRQSKVFALRQRAQIVLASDARSSAPEIARVLQTDENQVRRLIGEITAQRTRTWKWSNDPLFEVKKDWVLAAYQAAEAGTLDGVLVSFDECGPISLKPYAGQGWFLKGRPARQRATYHRDGGTRKLLGAYDVGADRLWGHVERRSVT